MAFAVFAPCAHFMRILFSVVFYCFWRSSIAIPFTKYRIYSASFYFVITGANILFCIILRIGGVIWNIEALLLKFCNSGNELRNGGANIWKFNNVGLWFFCKLSQFCKIVAHPLFLRKKVGEKCQNPCGQRNIPTFNIDGSGIG